MAPPDPHHPLHDSISRKLPVKHGFEVDRITRAEPEDAVRDPSIRVLARLSLVGPPLSAFQAKTLSARRKQLFDRNSPTGETMRNREMIEPLPWLRPSLFVSGRRMARGPKAIQHFGTCFPIQAGTFRKVCCVPIELIPGKLKPSPRGFCKQFVAENRKLIPERLHSLSRLPQRLGQRSNWFGPKAIRVNRSLRVLALSQNLASSSARSIRAPAAWRCVPVLVSAGLLLEYLPSHCDSQVGQALETVTVITTSPVAAASTKASFRATNTTPASPVICVLIGPTSDRSPCASSARVNASIAGVR